MVGEREVAGEVREVGELRGVAGISETGTVLVCPAVSAVLELASTVVPVATEEVEDELIDATDGANVEATLSGLPVPTTAA